MKSPMNEYTQTRAKPPARVKKYDEAEITRALNALIAFGGSPAAASRALDEAFGLKVTTDLLRTWRDSTHAEQYAELQATHGHAIEEAVVRDTRDLARAAANVERMAIEKAMEGVESGQVRTVELAQIALNMSKVKQSNIDKLMTLTGRPQNITEHRSAAEIIRALEAKGVIERES